jgi:tetratricopeptide (TPR) repeat protein
MRREKMRMNSTGVHRFTAVSAKPVVVFRPIALWLCCGALLRAADCDLSLSAQEKVARFNQLDERAEAAMQEHRPAEAVSLYREASCLVPDSARAYYGLGVAEAAAGQFRDAREALRTADRLQPTTGMPLLMQVRVNFSLGDIETLKANLSEAARRFPHDAQLHTNLARFLAERNLFLLALAEALRCESDTQDGSAQVQVAVLENTVGAHEDAIRNALAVEQNHALPEETRAAAAGIAGLSYESIHRPDRAATYLNEAIQLNPLQDNSYLALADLLDQQQKYADAVGVLKKAQTQLGDSKQILLALGTDLIRAEHYREGMEILHHLVRTSPDAEAYIALADAARKTGDADAEVSALQEVERYKPNYPMIHVLIAQAMLNQRAANYGVILNELSAAAKSTPEDAEIYLLQGKVYLALARYAEALQAFQRSVELRPLDPSTYYQLARVYQRLGKGELAREEFERVKYLESTGAK